MGGMGDGATARGLERIFGTGTVAGRTEAELLREFVTGGDRSAFAALVERHGPMVMGVCRRVLGAGADADDAFQATFLVLLRRAHSLPVGDGLGPWLHSVAWRVATRARVDLGRRLQQDTMAGREALAVATPERTAESCELKTIIDEEIGRLPEKYRLPIVLCYIEGLTREAASERLRWKPGVLRGRLDRARDCLRRRLSRRGLAPASALAAFEGLHSAADAVMPRELMAVTIAAGVRDRTVGTVAAAVESSAAMQMATSFLRSRALARAVVAASLLALAGLALAATSAIAMAGGRSRMPDAHADDRPPVGEPETKTRPFGITVVDTKGKPVPNAIVRILTTPQLRVEDILRGTVGPRGPNSVPITADPDGSLAFRLPENCTSLRATVAIPGYAPYYATWDGREHDASIPDRFRIELEPAWTLGGILVDPEGKPLGGVPVSCGVPYTLMPGMTGGIFHSFETRTDQAGRWRLESVPNSLAEVDVQVDHSPFQPWHRLVARTDYAVEAGREPTRRIMLEAGLTIAGNVADEAGNPIAGALIRSKFGSAFREARTDAKGSYRLEGCCEARQARIVASAPGRAVDMRELRVAPGLGPVDFSLGPGNRIRIRVLDARGGPVPRARILFQGWRGPFQSFEFDQVDQYADEKGVWEWKEAPQDAIEADICPPNGPQLSRQRIIAGGHEIVFRLDPPLVVSGRVVDAGTKAPIGEFRVVPGIRWGADRRLSWVDQDAFAGVNGHFEYRPDSPQDRNLIRVEAAGYASAASRDIRHDEGAVTLDFALVRSRGLVGKVLTPANQPAARTQIAVGIRGTQIQIRNGAILEQSSFCHRIRADDMGRFSLPAQDEAFQLIVVHPEGFARISSPRSWDSVRLIRLEPWSRVEGTFLVGNQPAANVPLTINRFPDGTPDGTATEGPSITWTHEAISGPDGRFCFERVLPGRGSLSRTIGFMEDHGAAEIASSCWRRIELLPGKTLRIDVGKDGRAVVGRLEVPGKREAPPWKFILIDMVPIGPGPAEESISFNGTAEPDGRFRLDGVPAGRYRLTARFPTHEIVRRQGLERTTFSRLIDVPPPARDPVGQDVDLGVLQPDRP